LFIFSDVERWNNCSSTLHAQFVLVGYTVGILSALSLLNILEGELLGYKKRILTKIYSAFAIVSVFLTIFVSFAVEYLNMIRLFSMIMNIFVDVGICALFTCVAFEKAIYC
jgi:hypothetical protein